MVVIFITNEDDCSAENNATLTAYSDPTFPDCDESASEGLYSTQEAIEFLDILTGGGNGRYLLVAIAGPGPGECESEFGKAREAFRLRHLIDSVGQWGIFGDLCQGDLWTSLSVILDKLEIVCDDFPVVE